MQGDVDFNTLTKEQLVALVKLRGKALQYSWEADRKFVGKVTGPDFVKADFDELIQAKYAIATHFGGAEELIIGGTDQTVN